MGPMRIGLVLPMVCLGAALAIAAPASARWGRCGVIHVSNTNSQGPAPTASVRVVRSTRGCVYARKLISRAYQAEYPTHYTGHVDPVGLPRWVMGWFCKPFGNEGVGMRCHRHQQLITGFLTFPAS